MARLSYVLILILLVAGWNESFKSQYERLTGQSPAPTPSPAPVAQRSPSATPRPQLKPTQIQKIDLGFKPTWK